MKKIKILEDISNSRKEFEKAINKKLKEGWKIRGNVFQGIHCLTVILYK